MFKFRGSYSAGKVFLSCSLEKVSLVMIFLVLLQSVEYIKLFRVCCTDGMNLVHFAHHVLFIRST